MEPVLAHPYAIGSPTDVGSLRDDVRAEVAKVVIGHRKAIDLLLVAAIAGGHVLLEGPPGVAKTLLAGSLARALGVRFTRIQFTPDTRPTDVTGESVVKMGEKSFVPGAVFTNVLLADEINRTPPRTQAALLEAMQEHHVTVDGRTHWLPVPFVVIATQNPFEHEGVFPLPESQLDRFLFKVVIGYPAIDEELQMLQLPHRGVTPDMLEDVRPLLDPPRLEQLQSAIDGTRVPDDVMRVLVELVRRTRVLPGVALGGSPRAAIHLLTAARASAWLAGRDTVTEEDVCSMAVPVLAHRIIATDGAAEDVVRAAVNEVAADAA
ncbi:MAG TPA: MoxR family ATPase [Gaiellaceae bacterium]|nr:MoxR family ATPase [Gaiellaceae bacterium]